MKKLITLFCLLGAYPSLLYGESGERLYEKARGEYFAAKGMPEGISKQSAYRKAASNLRKFLEIYPNHEKSVEVRFDLGSLYRDLALTLHDRESGNSSTHYFRELISKAPKDRLADDAWYGIYEICLKLFNDEPCAAEAKGKILSEYASGDMSAQFKPASDNEASPFEIRMNLDQPIRFVGKTLDANKEKKLPKRYFIDLESTKLDFKFQPNSFKPSDPVTQVRVGKQEKGVRVVFDLKDDTDTSRIQTRIDEHDLVVTFGLKPSEHSNSPDPIVALPSKPTEVPPKEEGVLPEALVQKEVKDGGKVRIIVDAGHGGEDAGAIGKKGTQEKDVCLAIALKVRDLLSQRKEYEVLMTRADDRFVALSDRTKFANKMNGDLFVSVHANASPRKGAHGVSTYFLDNHDDAEALRVAMRENAEPVMMANQPATPESDSQYLEIMKASMVKNFHTVQSTEFAQKVQTSLLKELRSDYGSVDDLGVKSARFYVLTGSTMPSILVETSFISNPKEEKRLKDSNYQHLIAKSILKGIDQFLKSSIGRGDHAALYR